MNEKILLKCPFFTISLQKKQGDLLSFRGYDKIQLVLTLRRRQDNETDVKTPQDQLLVLV